MGLGWFERADYERLAEQLGGIQGRFMLSLNDRPEVRAVFAGFAMEEVEISYSIGAAVGARKPRGELIITG